MRGRCVCVALLCSLMLGSVAAQQDRAKNRRGNGSDTPGRQALIRSNESVNADGKVTGKVISAITGLPVDEANIRVDESLAGCTTNGKGEFIIGNLPAGKHVLRVSHISYTPQSYTIRTGEKEVVIKLEDSFTNIGQVVVTGTGTHHRMTNSPVPVSVITAKDLKEANVTSLEDALTKLTSSFSFVTSGMGTTLSMNGLTEDYVLILENGKRLANDDTYARIDPANIKRIEVLNGAASALYGSDAIGGVINIITDDPQNTVSVASNSHYTSKNRFTQSVNADIHSGNFGSYTSYQRRQADGWQLNPMVETKGELVPTDKEASTAFHSNSVNQRFTYSATDRLSFYLRGAYFNNANDRPVTEYKYNMLHEDYTYGAGAQYMIRKGAFINADFFSDNFTSSYDYIQKSGKFQPGDTEERKRNRYYNGNVKGIFNIGSIHKLSTGVEFVSEYLRSESDQIDGKTMYTLALYAQDEIRILRSLQAVVGLRYIYHQNFHSYATPNVSLMYKLGAFNFRGSYAAGFRTPTLSQLYATDIAKTTDRLTIGNLDLKPEKNDYVSLNVEYVHSRFSVTASAYLNYVRNMINYRTLSKEEAAQYGHDEVRQRDNIDKAHIKGFNLTANGYLGAGFNLSAGYSFVDAKDVHADKPIDKSIKHTGNINLQWGHTWKFYRLSASLNGRIQGERFSQTYGYAPKFQLWDLNTRHSFRLKTILLEPGVGIENLFDYRDDRPWNSNYATLSPGRAAYVSLGIRFRP